MPLWFSTLSRWRHQMETFSALLARCEGNSPVTFEYPSQRPVTPSFDIFFNLRLNKHRDTGDLILHRAHYDVIGMTFQLCLIVKVVTLSHDSDIDIAQKSSKYFNTSINLFAIQNYETWYSSVLSNLPLAGLKNFIYAGIIVSWYINIFPGNADLDLDHTPSRHLPAYFVLEYIAFVYLHESLKLLITAPRLSTYEQMHCRIMVALCVIPYLWLEARLW